MIQDAVWAGLLPKHPLETRLAAVIETATSIYLSALVDEDQATATLYVQKAAQAADEAWQRTVGGLQGPSVAHTIASLEHPPVPLRKETVMIRTSQRLGRADSVRPSSKHSFHG